MEVSSKVLLAEMLIRRKNKLLLEKGNEQSNEDKIKKILALCKNIESLGYTFSKEICNMLLTYDDKEIYDFYQILIATLKKQNGSDKEYKPFYINFPLDIDKYSDWDLYMNAFMHYLTGGKLIPYQETKERMPLFEDSNLIILELGKMEDLIEIRDNLLSSKTSLSESDKNDLILLLNNISVNEYPLPEITYKEILCMVFKWYLNNKPIEESYKIIKQLRTITDVLRVAVALVDGDISLSDKNFRFSKKFSRTIQRFFFTAMENASNQEDDMKRNEYLWKNFSSCTNISDYKNRFPKTYNTFFKLWNGKLKNYNSKLQEAFDNKDRERVIELLKQRPGEFARHLDYVLRSFDDKDQVVDSFDEIAEKISTPVLLQLMTFYQHRNKERDSRIFFPKSSLQKAYVVTNNLLDIEEKYAEKIVESCKQSLIDIFNTKEPLGSVFISDSIKGYVIPQSQRSASEGKKIITRCSRFPFTKNNIRMFINWQNILDENGSEDSTDIDLSCSFLNDKYELIKRISYTNLKEDFAVHSGDYVDAPRPDGACEFIDIDLEAARKEGIRFAVMQVYAFTFISFCDMEYLDVGWMERNNLDCGEVFEPSLVQNKINILGNSSCSIPLVIDLEQKEIVWLDLAVTVNARFPRNVESNTYSISTIVKGLMESNKPQMFDLAVLNAISRGKLVEDRNKADIIFDTNTEKPIKETVVEERDQFGVLVKETIVREPNEDVKIITPFDCDYWQSEML